MSSTADVQSLFFQLHAVGGIQILLLYGFGLVLRYQTDRSAAHELEALTDPLTQLGNRRFLTHCIEQEMARFERSGDPFSLILFDIDYFKMVNDRYGHNAGDQALKEIGHLLTAHARKMDFVGRWGGEEFLIVLPTSKSIEAGGVAERLRVMLAQHSFGEIGSLTGSFGVAEYWPGEGMTACLERVDHALYQAKSTGRDRVELFEHLHVTN